MKILLISLGCDKNLVDSEVMLGKLNRKGFSFTSDKEEADIIIVNTCCFINDAKEESINTILEMAELRKKEGGAEILIVAGCLAQRYQEKIRMEIPEVDAILGTLSINQICKLLDGLLRRKNHNYIDDINNIPMYGTKRILTTGGHYAHLKIAEGCDKHCTYCIIPSIRGKFRSIPMEYILDEAQRLVDGGVKELILIAQETTMYGMDLTQKKQLPELIKKLCEIEQLEWVRILYTYPEEITDELIQVIKEEDKVCNYLDMPIQHASDSVLKRMGRKTTQQELKNTIEKIRTQIPDICIRTTIITGFPGETEEDHQDLMNFVDEIEFDRLGVFTYSQEEGTPAATMENQVPEERKEAQREEIMLLQQEIAFEKAQSMVGKRIKAMIEGKIIDENAYMARTYKDAPEVDGLIFVNTERELMTGDFVEVIITASSEYDLIGELVDEFTK